MNDKERNIEMDVADAIMERPAGFTVGKRSFFIHPVTLGKMYLLARLFDSLEISKQVVSTNPYMEAIRICKTKRDIVCRILSYSTFNRKNDLFDNSKVDKRTKLFSRTLSEEELATILVLILTSDNMDTFLRHYGIDKENTERKRIAKVKKDNSSISFGGNSTYGTMIDFACQRYGWTFDYVVWGISYINLRMLMADAITTVYLSSDEMKQLGISGSEEIIDAGNPKNRERIKALLEE